MSQSGRPWSEIRQLAKELIRRCSSAEHLNALRTDLVSTIEARPDVDLIYQRSRTLVTGCNISGAYIRRRPPALPRLVVADTDDPRRDRFTLGHEYCHHLIDHDMHLADLLFREPDRGHALEEDICDSFAAYLLVRGHDVDTALDGQPRVTVHAVQELYRLSAGSLEVCSIALGYRMTGNAHILVCTPDANDPCSAAVHLTTHNGKTRPPTRTVAVHTPLLATALEHGHASGQSTLSTDTGTFHERHLDIVHIDQRVVCVVGDSNDGP